MRQLVSYLGIIHSIFPLNVCITQYEEGILLSIVVTMSVQNDIAIGVHINFVHIAGVCCRVPLCLQTMCMPDVDTVTRQLTKPIHRTKAKSVFLARDSQRYDSDIAATLKKLSVGFN